MWFKKSEINRYTDARSCCYVLSCLLKRPKLALSRERNMSEELFVVKTHKALYLVIENLAKLGLEKINLEDIESYLATHDQLTHNRFFVTGDETEWILSLLELDTDENNFDYYYSIIQKFAFLRAKMETGQDVKDVLDMSEVNSELLDEQYRIFVETPIEEIIRHYDSLSLEVKHKFTRRQEGSNRKSGDEARELFQRLNESPDYGYRLSLGRYFDTLCRGAREGMLVIDSRESGTGKTRDALLQCCMASCHTLWSHEKKCFIPNPYGKVVPSLYLGTELKLYEEIEPILWAVVSGVESSKIKKNDLTSGERERVLKAIEILEESQIYLEREPNYDCRFLEDMVEKYVDKYGVKVITIDYVELTVAMIGEYSRMTRGIQAREDSVLLNVSTVLKNLAEEYSVFIKFYTQLSDLPRRDYTVRDSGGIKGSRSLQVRTDLAILCLEPVKKELELVSKLVEQYGVPNMCFHCYKNRDGELKSFKVWVQFNLGTFEMKELFITKSNYEPFQLEQIVNLVCEEQVDEFADLLTDNVEIFTEVETELGVKVNRRRKGLGSRVSRN